MKKMFLKDEFSNILSQINATYPTMTEFATFAKLDRTYISKYINKKLDNPPTPKILEKIANASKGLVSYEHLMQVCGYIYVTELSTSSYGIDIEYWKLIFGNSEKVKLTQKGSMFFSSFLEKMTQESKKSKDGIFIMDFNPELVIPKTDDLEEFTEYIKLFSFVICSLISTNVISLNESEKKQLLIDIQNLLNSVPIIEPANTDFRYAEYNGINTEGLDENDIEEIKRFVEFVKNKKMNDKK